MADTPPPVRPGLGRLPRFDERSRSFPAAVLIEGQAPRSYTWGCPVTLDQGREGACTGFAMAHELAARPVAVSVGDALARTLYHEAQHLDPWPGCARGEEGIGTYEGSSVLGAAKAAQARGYFAEYRWVFGGADELATVVSRAGPCVIGVAWHEGMMTPDADGWIRLSGAEVGGHAVIVRGYSVKAARFTIRNSWGPGWGNGGDAYISHEHMRLLLSNAGEALVPLKRALGT